MFDRSKLVHTRVMAIMSGLRFLVFGHTGWIGGKLVILLQEQGQEVHLAKSRLENVQDVIEELDLVKPTHVLMAAGLTGRPNVDWCETNKEATIRVNVIGTLSIADQCSMRNIHCTIFGTGCIYRYDAQHPIGCQGFTEDDPANFSGSFYSTSKGMVQELLKTYKGILLLRLRMPVSDDLSYRSFVTKIASYKRVVNVPNSISVLRELLPLSVAMATRKVEGVYNFTNPGVLSHNEILEMFKEHVDPGFTWENFSLDDQRKVLLADRSNNALDPAKLRSIADELGLPLPTAKDAMVVTMKNIRAHLEATGGYPSALPKKSA